MTQASFRIGNGQIHLRKETQLPRALVSHGGHTGVFVINKTPNGVMGRVGMGVWGGRTTVVGAGHTRHM